jgi:hypothetical protein
VASAPAAVLAYRAISLWLPALLGSVAFAQLRRSFGRATAPVALCPPPPARAHGLPFVVHDLG